MGTETQEKSPLVAHAESELRAAGLFDPGSDYEGMLGESVLELIQTFSNQGHSGFSAGMTVELFKELASYRPLGPLTDNPEEWMQVDDGIASDEPLWQSRRKSSCFSHDGGKTYYDIEDPMNADGNLPTHNSKEHKSA